MARSSVLIPALLLGALAFLVSQRPTFVPPAGQVPSHLRAGAAAIPALLAATPAAYADSIGDAAAKFTDATYPLAEKINWGNNPIISNYLATASAKDPKGMAQAISKLLDSGLSMDPALIRAAVKAHDKAIEAALNQPGLVAPKADFAKVNEATARMIASADQKKFFALLDAFPGNKDLQMSFFSQNDEAQAQAAYKAFEELTQAVKASSSDGANALAVQAATGGRIGDAAQKFSDATYPVAAKIDWGNTKMISKYISEVSANNPKATAYAFDKVLESGLTMDPKLVTAAVAAHKQAIDGAVNNPGLMATKRDWEAVNEALARMIASADPASFKALLTTFPGNGNLQSALFALNNPQAAKDAFETFEKLTQAVRFTR